MPTVRGKHVKDRLCSVDMGCVGALPSHLHAMRVSSALPKSPGACTKANVEERTTHPGSSASSPGEFCGEFVDVCLRAVFSSMEMKVEIEGPRSKVDRRRCGVHANI